MSNRAFFITAKGRHPFGAFMNAKESVNNEPWSLGGCTHTIAAKADFKMFLLNEGEDPRKVAEEILDGLTDITDKWGPVGCIKIKEGDRTSYMNEYLFFGVSIDGI